MRYVFVPSLLCPLLGFLFLNSLVQAQREPMNYDGNPGGLRYLEEGQPPAMVHPTIQGAWQAPFLQPASSGNLYYHGGTSDGSAGTIGVETTPKVYVVFWGSQWNNNDPSGETSILIGTGNAGFLGGVGGSSWLNTVRSIAKVWLTALSSVTVPVRPWQSGRHAGRVLV